MKRAMDGFTSRVKATEEGIIELKDDWHNTPTQQ